MLCYHQVSLTSIDFPHSFVSPWFMWSGLIYSWEIPRMLNLQSYWQVCILFRDRGKMMEKSVTSAALAGFAFSWNSHVWPVSQDLNALLHWLHPSIRDENEPNGWRPISTMRSSSLFRPWKHGPDEFGSLDITELSCQIGPGHLHRLHLFCWEKLWCLVNPLTLDFSCPVWLI